ncbi:MAG: iron-sulfur cluster assembly scaffold protein [Desulfobacteraceae bacterium]|nr:iron-sulfur cluster assembly scaffold protein [Desulfobacteraceae bacterium]MBC2757597.1 iron-sulfur cluster assembly scaffold protein [Desulfobacteraceae bacterium]
MDDFWNKHSQHYLEMAFQTDRCEIVTNADGYGKNTGECGDTIEIFLTINNNRIQWVSFVTDGCINTRACANTVAMMAEKKTIKDAWKITTEDVISYLETLPEESFHCAELAVGALYLALTNARMNQKDSWKKLYQKNASK